MALSDYEQIQNLKARYCASADSAPEGRDSAHAALQALFADDVSADYGMGDLEGGAALATFLSDAIAANSIWMVHNLHSPLIEIEGDTARGQWTVNVRMKRHGKDEPDFVFGRYFDEFRKTAEGWKICRVEFRRYE